MSEKIVPKLFESNQNLFIDHLQLPNNSKIVFSGKFGIGKTTFLKDYFFKNYTRSDKEYEVFTLSPVNYSVSSNEDIFELIKVDILYNLLEKKLVVDNKEPDTAILISAFLDKKGLSIAKNTGLLLTKVGASVFDTITKIKSGFNPNTKGIVSELEKYVESIKADYQDVKEEYMTHYQSVIEYINSQEEDISILESDAITELIKLLLSSKKILNERLENILVIDDLDRLDPHHIFRILNVIACHIDNDRYLDNLGHNKFGFDKIIVVCDIENLKNIYHHVYGEKTDFNGYFDKFYSTSVFEFDNTKEVLDFITKDIQKLIGAFQLENGISYKKLRDVIYEFVSQKQVNLRTLFRYRKDLVGKIEDRTFESRGRNRRVKENYGMTFIAFLIAMLGSKQKLIDSFHKIRVPSHGGINNYFIEVYASIFLYEQVIREESVSIPRHDGTGGFKSGKFSIKFNDINEIDAGSEFSSGEIVYGKELILEAIKTCF